MAISPIAVGQKIAAGLINKLIAAVNGIALNGVIPTSVEGTGVTMSPGGRIQFSGATAVSINGVFTGSYDNYRITWTVAASASTTANIRLRAAGNDDTSSRYDWVRSSAAGTSMTVASSSSSTNAPLDVSLGANQISQGTLDLLGPAIAFTTQGNAQSSVLYASALTASTVAVANENSTAFDGFTLYPNNGAATWNGVIRVYGYNNLI